MKSLWLGVAIAIAPLTVSAGDLTSKACWSEFRGPHGSGHSPTSLPETWSETQGVKWKTPIHGKAWSSPVVCGDRIWLTTAPPDGKKLQAICVDANSGKIVHDLLVFENPFPQYVIDRNSYASSTPVVDDDRVFVHYGAHGTACLDAQSGKSLWTRRDLPCFHHRGPASSPILFEHLLILTFDGFDQQYVVALDKITGKTVWKTDRRIDYGSDNGDIKKAYGTPTIVPVGDSVQLVSPSAGATIAYDPRTGKELWRVNAGGMNVSARPIYNSDFVFLNTADGGFVQYAVKPDGQGDVTGTHVIWKNTKGVPKYGTPILVGELILMANEQGILTCIEAATGKSIWQKRVGGSFTASPIYAAGRVYFFNEEGETLVIRPERSFELLATNQLAEGCMATPAAAEKALFVRTLHHLYRIE